MWDSIDITNIQETTFRTPEEPREILDRIALSGCVYDTEHLLQVVLQQLCLVSEGRI